MEVEVRRMPMRPGLPSWRGDLATNASDERGFARHAGASPARPALRVP